jgi:hypothetical protein
MRARHRNSKRASVEGIFEHPSSLNSICQIGFCSWVGERRRPPPSAPHKTILRSIVQSDNVAQRIQASGRRFRLSHLATANTVDAVRNFDPRRPVSNLDHSMMLALTLFQISLFCFEIESTRHLVENQKARLKHARAGELRCR